MYLLSPYFVIRLLIKSRSVPAYGQRILERFCIGHKIRQPADVWLHAVSLGEVIAATPLIDALLAEHYSVLITTMTPTGSAQVRSRFGDQVAHCYIPYDLPGALKRFFSQVHPKVGVIVETELWPNLVYQAKQFQVPLLLANARLSERSLRGYLKLKRLFKPILNQFLVILAQSEDDALRFTALGAQKSSVQVLGNMKFDLQAPLVPSALGNTLKKSWGHERVVFIAASTHDDEELQILSGLRQLQQAIPKILLLIAPRHPERFKTVYQLCVHRGFNTGLRSEPSTVTPGNEVIVMDSLGELLELFKVSDYAFVGGSLVPRGGHNVLEPIALQVPVISGHFIYNFKTICKELEEAKAILLVHHVDELIDAIIHLHQDKEFQQQMVASATAVLERNKGAVDKHLQKIKWALSLHLMK